MNPPSSLALTGNGLEVEGRIFAGALVEKDVDLTKVYPIGTVLGFYANRNTQPPGFGQTVSGSWNSLCWEWGAGNLNYGMEMGTTNFTLGSLNSKMWLAFRIS